MYSLLVSALYVFFALYCSTMIYINVVHSCFTLYVRINTLLYVRVSYAISIKDVVRHDYYRFLWAVVSCIFVQLTSTIDIRLIKDSGREEVTLKIISKYKYQSSWKNREDQENLWIFCPRGRGRRRCRRCWKLCTSFLSHLLHDAMQQAVW